MKNGNKILLGIFTFVLVCVIGYALFSDTISITGSATTSGDWSITASCSDTIPAEVQEDYALDDIQGGYENDSCTVSGNTITSKATLLYPSAMKLHHAEYKNTGSVNAVFKLGKEAHNPLMDAASQDGAVTGNIKLYNKTTNELYKTYGENDQFDYDNYGVFGIDKMYVKSKDGHYWNSESELLDNKVILQDSAGNYYLRVKPGESLVLILSENWYYRAEQTDYYSVMQFNLNMKLNQEPDNLIEITEITGSFDNLCMNHC